MPTYEFLCPICNKQKEEFFSVYTTHILRCEDCNVEMDKQFSAAPVHFKGTGFYKTGG